MNVINYVGLCSLACLSLKILISIFTLLKKIIAIFLLLQIVTNNAFAEELVKMPRLVTHFYHHSHEHKDTKDFFDFLHKHYSDHHENDKHSQKHSDEDNDCNLPFKHCNNCCLNIHISTIGFLPTFLNTEFFSIQIKNENFFPENDRIESFDFSSIWQPPKLA